jgi:hypothetical protein
VGELVATLPGGWVLIGGLIITDVRLTRDIDVLGQARPPGALRAIDEALPLQS